MCGIAGFVSVDTTDRSVESVRRMLAQLRHRGPDDEGIAGSIGATLGARRLSIIDLAGGHQPMTNEDGSVFAVQNGEIYNFRELRDELVAAGHIIRTRNDTEILPHAWEQWREELVPRLQGMFAIAIWDSRSRVLLLARDRFGKKPLVYARVPDGLVFASEIQALLTHPSVRRDVDDQAIEDYLTLGYIPAPRTGFAQVRKLLPGSRLLLTSGAAAEIRRYWTIKYTPKLKIAREEAIGELRRLIDVAVQRRLISDVPLGAFLSGGLDSSTVVAHMARHSNTPVQTFSVGFRNARFDESRFARIVATAYGTDHHELVVDASDVAVLPGLVRHLGEPFADSSIVPTYQIARVTRPHVKVVLTGDGGDELFGGYGRYRAAAIASRLPGAGRKVAAALARVIPLRAGVPRVVARARRFLAGLGLDAESRHLAWTGYFTGPLRDIIAGERIARTGGDTTDERLERAARLMDADDVSEQYMAADILSYLPDDLLVKMDIATMACSLEARAPLLDHELHEFVARLPQGHKVSWLESKILLKRAMRGILPDAIVERRDKMGFTAPVGSWLRGPLREMVGDLLSSPEAAARGYVAARGVTRLVREHSRGEADRTMQVWSLLMLELWFREVVTSNASMPEPLRPTISPLPA